MATFSDFLRNQGSSASSSPQKNLPQRTAPGSAMPNYDFSWMPAAGQSVENPEPQSPLNWAMDIISRPLFAATSTVSGIGEGIARVKEGKNPLEIGGAVLENNPLVGLFSTDESQKRTYGDVMEEQTDRHGALDDPNYVDIQDNVDPVAKGVFGFAADVVLDPLTWIPGGLIAKGAKAVIGGTKTALAAGEKAAASALKKTPKTETAVKVSEDVPAARVIEDTDNPFGSGVISEAPTAKPNPAQVVSTARNSDNAFVKKTLDKYDTELSKGAKASPVKLAKAESAVADNISRMLSAVPDVPVARVKNPATAGDRTMQELLGSTKGAPIIRQELQTLLDSVGTKAATAAPKMGTWVKENLKKNLFDETDVISPELNNLLSGLTLSKAGGPGSIGRLAVVAQNRGGAFPPAVAEEANKHIRSLYQRGVAETGKLTDTGVADALMAFEIRKGQDADRLRNVLGSPLFDLLESKATAGQKSAFDRMVRETVRVLDPTADGAAIEKLFSAKNSQNLPNAITDSLGLPRSEYVKAVANTPEEAVVARAAAGESSPVVAALQKVYSEELPISAEFKRRYPHREGTVAFDDIDKTVRSGNNFLEVNSMTQYSLIRALWNDKHVFDTVERMTGKPLSELKGKPNARAVAAAHQRIGQDFTAASRELGLPQYVGIGGDLKPISQFEVDDVLRSVLDEDAYLLTLHNGGSAVSTTPLLQAVHTVVSASEGVSDDVLKANILEELTNPYKHGVKGDSGDLLPNALNGVRQGKKGISSAVAQGWHFNANAQGAARELASRLGGQAVKNVREGKTVGYWVRFPKTNKFVTSTGKTREYNGLANTLADALVASRGALAARVADNQLAWAARGIDESARISSAELKRIREVLTGPSAMDDVVSAIAGSGKAVNDAASEISALGSSVVIAKNIVEEAVGATEMQISKTLKTAEGKVNGGKPRAEVATPTSQKVFDEIEEELDLLKQDIDDPLEKMLAPDVDDAVPALDFASMKADPVIGQNAFFSTKLGDGLKKSFDQSYGMGRWWNVLHSKKTNGSEFLASQVSKLRELRKLPAEAQVAGWNAVRSGVPNGNPEIQAASSMIQDILNPIFGSADNADRSLLNNVFLSTESDLDHINDILRQKFGPETSFQFDETIDGWKQWELNNPSEDLYRLMDAAATVVEHRAIVGSFTSTMKKAGLLSTEAKPGFVRVENSGGSTFARLIPEGTYVDRQMASELHRLDILTRTDRNLQGEVGEFIRKSFIPSQNIWKQLVTVYRPGHHVRNAMGNSFMSWIDRGNRHYLQSQKDAFKVLAVKNNYSDLDLVDALKSFTDDAMPTGGEVIVRGKYGDITAREMFEIFERNGLKSTYASSEDLMQEAGMGAIGRAGEALTNSRVGQLAGNVSHVIDHQGKLSHLIQILKQEAEGGRYAQFGKNLSKEQVIQRAVRQVKRAHPDSLMLTPFEAKYRFLIPFYTWFAKTMPFAMESALRNPGRIAAIPKASYNLAVATGVNPDSLIDPFPEDQLFPSYLTEGVFGPQFVGPDGEYINVNPGTPQFDMIKSMMDPLSMVSPFLKVPAELATESRVGGAPIRDMSDYLDQNLPLVNYLANMTGTSVTGSIPSVLQGQGLDPQAQVAAGNKGGFDQGLTFSNWFTGLNAQNWSRPNYVNSAEIEKRNRLSGNDKGGF